MTKIKEINRNQTSFKYRQIFGDCLMIVLPHQDDEINIAGSSIVGAIGEGIRVYCVYLTNGDRDYRAAVRMKEAVHALSVLGVPARNVIFLGYPDGGLHADRSLYMRMKCNDGILNVKGRSETYGIPEIPDFCFQETGKHHAYLWKNVLVDLKNVILKYKPSTIIGTDFDYHPDHRACSFALETVLGNILKAKGNSYFPRVLKGFAYAPSYESINDFYSSPNLYSSIIDKNSLCVPEDETDNPGFLWSERIRIPVPECCGKSILRENRIFAALKKHYSQRAYQKAVRIINSDQVFWERRTDNLTFRGTISVSSGNGNYLNDFKKIGTNDIAPHKVVWDDYLWVPDKNDKDKTCRVTFDNPVSISKICLYGNIDSDSYITKGELLFSNGERIAVDRLNERGRETCIDFATKNQISWVQYRIIQSEGKSAGISEFEIFGPKESNVKLLFISIDGNLAHNWHLINPNIKPQIEAYQYNLGGELQWFMDGHEMLLEDISTTIGKDSLSHIIRVQSVKNESIWDECVIYPYDAKFLRKWRKKILKDKIYYKLEHAKQKLIHRILKRYKDQK